MASIEQKQLQRQPIAQARHHPSPDIFARPCRAEPLAFDAEKRDLIEGVHCPQPRIELQAVDDPDRIAQPDMLGTQVSMAIDDAAIANALRQHPLLCREKTALYRIDPPDQACGKA